VNALFVENGVLTKFDSPVHAFGADETLVGFGLRSNRLRQTPCTARKGTGERFDFVAILHVFLAEALHHKTLFSPGLKPKRKPANQNPDKTTYPASLKRRAEHPQQDARCR
jgi:hypothetical protein